VFKQEIQDLPGVCEEKKQKYSGESAEKPWLLHMIHPAEGA
jgi:hypothetical protein